MRLEYCYHDTTSKDQELIENVTKAIKFPIDTVSVLPPYLKATKPLLINNSRNIVLSCPIDFPLGIMDLNSRIGSAEYSIKNGATIIEVLCPTYYLCNRKYDKFREDIKALQQLCAESNVEIRYILEYRHFTYELLYKVAQILLDFQVKIIYPSTGYFLDDISDNILASALINKKVPDINIICNGNLWNPNQIKMVKSSHIYGLRVNSINALEILADSEK
jgi:deoxyribose-phosphate aldolase